MRGYSRQFVNDIKIDRCYRFACIICMSAVSQLTHNCSYEYIRTKTFLRFYIVPLHRYRHFLLHRLLLPYITLSIASAESSFASNAEFNKAAGSGHLVRNDIIEILCSSLFRIPNTDIIHTNDFISP